MFGAFDKDGSGVIDFDEFLIALRVSWYDFCLFIIIIKLYTSVRMYIVHPGPEWHIFHILTSEDINDVISRFCMVVCASYQTPVEKWQAKRFVDMKLFTED